MHEHYNKFCGKINKGNRKTSAGRGREKEEERQGKGREKVRCRTGMYGEIGQIYWEYAANVRESIQFKTEN